MSSRPFFRSPGYLALIALVLAYVVQINLDAQRFYSSSTAKVEVSLNYFIEPQPPSPTNARLTSFGATEFMADWYWLKIIQYYGGGDPGGQYRKLAEMFHLVTELSPRFTAAYQTGLLILPGEGFVDEAIALGKKGQDRLPERWEMPYYTGLVYHISKKDYAAAAAEFERAATKQGAPAITKLFAAIYYKEANSRQTAYQLFKTIYETGETEFARERAAKYVEHLNIYFMLEDATRRFYSEIGRYPKNADELLSARYVESIPPSPLNQTFLIDPVTGTISETKTGSS